MSKLTQEVTSTLLGVEHKTHTLEDLVAYLASAYPETPAREVVDRPGPRGLQMSEVPIFNGEPDEDFDIWYRRASMYLETYRPEERIHRLCSRLGRKPLSLCSIGQRGPGIILNFCSKTCAGNTPCP